MADYSRKDESPLLMAEVKWSQSNLSRNFQIFSKYFPEVEMIQISAVLDRERSFPNGAQIRSAHNWRDDFSLAG